MERNPVAKDIYTILSHRVEVVITDVDPEEMTPHVGCDSLTTCYIDDRITEQIEAGSTSGHFTDYPDVILPGGRKATVEVKGYWRIVPDFDLWRRIFLWSYNRSVEQSLNEEMFRETYGNHTGSHYYDKWRGFGGSIEKMAGYFSNDHDAGQKFMAMVMTQVVRYEQEFERHRVWRRRGQHSSNNHDHSNQEPVPVPAPAPDSDPTQHRQHPEPE
ncbi:MAG: hypothetical protein LBH06_04225 [Rikenellaceae bacterium]|jgi:hypothetical protein|nr:hypothetical protein [Rikenellaceae bacterium]